MEIEESFRRLAAIRTALNYFLERDVERAMDRQRVQFQGLPSGDSALGATVASGRS